MRKMDVLTYNRSGYGSSIRDNLLWTQCQQLEGIEKALVELREAVESLAVKRKKQKPSAWAVFAGKQMRQGKSITEAADLWKKKSGLIR